SISPTSGSTSRASTRWRVCWTASSGSSAPSRRRVQPPSPLERRHRFHLPHGLLHVLVEHPVYPQPPSSFNVDRHVVDEHRLVGTHAFGSQDEPPELRIGFGEVHEV